MDVRDYDAVNEKDKTIYFESFGSGVDRND